MSILNLRAGYFAIPDPGRVLKRWLHRYRHVETVTLGERRLEVRWTARAARELQRRDRPLTVELQLYFSCVVKKRVLFHDEASLDTAPVTGGLRVAFRAVASAACDPLQFAASHPQGESLTSAAAARMIPRRVQLDFRRGDWAGEFYY